MERFARQALGDIENLANVRGVVKVKPHGPITSGEMEYIRAQCQSRDGKLLAIGHSMGGILLYARLSRSSTDCCWKQIKEPVMKLYTETTDGSTIKDKETTLV